MKYIFWLLCVIHMIAVFYVLYTTNEISRIDIALGLVWGAMAEITSLRERVEKLESHISKIANWSSL